MTWYINGVPVKIDGPVYEAGEGIGIEGNQISVTTPVKSLTQAEYDALGETEKRQDVLRVVNGGDNLSAFFGAAPVFGPRGPAGPDGNPIGTVISYMGAKAPKDYLVCDGAAYRVADYPRLAEFFKEQFGSAGYFGGDGGTAFAVPDLRNLFLRGYHGENGDRLSGEIGKTQPATENLYLYTVRDFLQVPVSDSDSLKVPKNADKITSSSKTGLWTSMRSYDSDGMDNLTQSYYTARPVNAAVLYCIKAAASTPCEEVYTTEETVVGTWIDGKPLYRKVTEVKIPDTGLITSDVSLEETIDKNFETLVKADIIVDLSVGDYRVWPTHVDRDISMMFQRGRASGWAWLRANSTSAATYYQGATLRFILEYTKTTDQGAGG